MKKVSIWSLVVVLALLLYVVLVILFRLLFQQISNRPVSTVASPAPTFTPAPVATVVVVVTNTPETSPPTSIATASATSEPTPTDAPSATPSATPTRTPPQVVSSITVNIRSGPGTNYPVVGTMLPNSPLIIVGQNASGTWWQIQRTDGGIGWVAASVVQASPNVDVPLAQAPPPPQPPTPTPAPPEPTAVPQPSYQFEPTGWFDDTNYGLTRFLGTITDANGNPVNGVFVEAQCGDFRVISNPSGPVGWGPFNESHDWPPGFYDITLDNKPIACQWSLSVVETPDKETVTARLSEVIEVETTFDKSIITANWQKNW